jgi:hypothetical protein
MISRLHDLVRRRPGRPRYAALSYVGTDNLGDEIQTIAACRFLPRIDAWVDRERLDEFSSRTPHKIILNGWFLHRPEHWPPSGDLHPLITSFHLTREVHPGYNERMLPPSATVLAPVGIEYLRRFEPIGARDLDTLERLEAVGLDAYFSGCLTLTLRPPGSVSRGSQVYAVDVADDIVVCLTRRHDEPITRLTHADAELAGHDRFERAEALLGRYASAKAVVTSGLHCALPCLALGTPVLFVEAAPDAYRFSGLRDLLHRASAAEILAGKCDFDISDPPRNGDRWRRLRDGLETTCRDFVAHG